MQFFRKPLYWQKPKKHTKGSRFSRERAFMVDTNERGKWRVDTKGFWPRNFGSAGSDHPYQPAQDVGSMDDHEFGLKGDRIPANDRNSTRKIPASAHCHPRGPISVRSPATPLRSVLGICSRQANACHIPIPPGAHKTNARKLPLKLVSVSLYR